MLRPVAVILCVISATSAFATAPLDTSNQLIISVRDQKLVLLRNGSKVATYPISTSMFGLGDAFGRMTTPLGYLAVEKKIGDNVPVGAVFHKRRLTGEVLQPNAPGRDPITTRIIWLRGLEAQNAHAFQRCIYIHGTPEENKIGRPASYGCIRMKSKDVAELYDQVSLGAVVQIIPDRLPKMEKAKPRQEMSGGVVAANTTPQPAPQIAATKAAKITTQPAPQIAATTVAKATAQPPPEITATKAANVTPQAPPQISASMLAMPPSSSLSLEQMRTAGALAGARQKAKLAANKRL
ncbi:MAG TPA: L,D-transpeptidase [Candidatus Udaeobacter sp.]